MSQIWADNLVPLASVLALAAVFGTACALEGPAVAAWDLARALGVTIPALGAVCCGLVWWPRSGGSR